MEMDDQANSMQEDESMMMPGTSTHDPLTYDPTQGTGTSAWQLSVQKSMERNAQLRRN